MKHIKLFESFVEELYEAMAPNMPVMVKGENGHQKWNYGASQSSMLSTVRKLVTPEGKKALAGAYMDDADLVNNKTSKTIVTIGIGMTPVHVAKAVNAWAEKHAAMFAPKNKSVADSETIEIKSETRAIVAVDAATAVAIKKAIHNTKAGIQVRIMDRKDGAKVYIDTESKDALSAAVAKVKSMVG
jgi:hypothetical protein